MRALKDIASTRVVAIDVETTRVTKLLSEASEAVQIAWRYKNKNEGEYPEDFELASLWETKAALYPEFSKICSVSLVFLSVDGNMLNCMNFTSANEMEILINLSDTIARMTKSDPLYRLIGHSAKSFDYPFICKRMLVNGVTIPTMLDSSGLKPWEVKNLDSNELWKFGGMIGASLVAMCAALGVPISKNEMAGHEVGIYFYEGKLAMIGSYCDLDTIALFNCFRRFKGEAIFRFEDVNYIGDAAASDAQAVAELPQMPCLNQLYNTKEFSEHVQEEIKDRFLKRSKKIMKKEWPMLEDLLCSLYVETAMFKADTKDVAATKKEEVAEFVENLKKEYYA